MLVQLRPTVWNVLFIVRVEAVYVAIMGRAGFPVPRWTVTPFDVTPGTTTVTTQGDVWWGLWLVTARMPLMSARTLFIFEFMQMFRCL